MCQADFFTASVLSATSTPGTAGPAYYSWQNGWQAEFVGSGSIGLAVGGADTLNIGYDNYDFNSGPSDNVTESTTDTVTGTITYTYTATAVPEPLTLAAVGMGIAGLGGYIRRRRAAAQK